MSLEAPGSVARADAAGAARSRAADFLELCKLRITMMVALSALAGFLMGTAGRMDLGLLAATVIGTGLACAGANALNMWMEQDTDALMLRTCRRPLPAGRLGKREALGFGVVVVTAGIAVLGALANPLTMALATASAVSYVLLYTPLKRRTGLALYVGAVPGAIPPMLGYTGASGALGAGALALFAILFFWQIPHFSAIDWLCRADYTRAGFPTSAVRDPAGGIVGRQALLYGIVLVPVGLAPALLGLAGPVYLWGALVLSLAYAAAALGLLRNRTDAAARRLLLASVAYLPLIFLLMALDRIP
ncbi:MAG: heme o synthase [Acidobacteriota bacterium]